MLYTTDTEIELPNHKPNKYIISSQHRKVGNINKSVWVISHKDEFNCFVNTLSKNWIDGGHIAWGIVLLNSKIQVVGLNSSKEELKIAKFIDGDKRQIWHGYPADYMNKAQDRPVTEILRDWVKNGVITKSKMSKIRQGISCNL